MVKERVGCFADAYDVKTAEDNKKLYEQWSSTYDKQLTEDYGWVAPMKVVEVFRTFAPNAEKVLDAGCGTGLVAVELKKNPQYQHIDGCDISQDMLNVAKEKNLYEKLLLIDLNELISLDSNIYDAIISVGTFTHGHVGPHGLRELIRLVHPDGILCFSVNEGVWEKENYPEVLDRFVDEKLTDTVEIKKCEYLLETECMCYIVTLRKLQ